MSDTMIWLLPVFMIAAVFAWAVYCNRRRRATPDPHGLTWLRSRLPAPPLGHVWETYIRYDDNGRPVAHLALVNLATDKRVAEMTESTPLRYYSGLLDWAQVQCRKYSGKAGLVEDYQLGDRDE